jgi:aspartate/methionine/tyrosine aminotransferase
MKPIEFRLYNWIHRYSSVVKHNLSASGLSEPTLNEMGIDTDYQHFRDVSTEAESLFKASVAKIYGVEPQNVLPTIGGSEAIFLFYACFCEKASKSFVPLPNYEPLFDVPKALGLQVEDLTPKSDLKECLVALTDSNNPVGRRLPKDYLAELLTKAEDNGSQVLIDETFREFGFQESPSSSFQSWPNTVVSNTMTKFYGLGGFRTGWFIADEEKIQGLKRTKSLISTENPAYSLWIAHQALENRWRFFASAKKRVEQNKRLVEEFVESTQKIEWSNPDAAPFCLVNYEGDVDSVTLCTRAAEKAGILIAPSEFFGSQKGFRLCFTSEQHALESALQALSSFLVDELK